MTGLVETLIPMMGLGYDIEGVVDWGKIAPDPDTPMPPENTQLICVGDLGTVSLIARDKYTLESYILKYDKKTDRFYWKSLGD